MKTEPGTIVSAGTLRAADLLQAFSDELRRVTDGMQPDIGLLSDADALMDTMEHGGDYHGDSSDIENEADEVTNEIADRLSEYAPEGCYFGAHEGDGALFGYWPVNYEDRVMA